jgi:hypothetical protein
MKATAAGAGGLQCSSAAVQRRAWVSGRGHAETEAVLAEGECSRASVVGGQVRETEGRAARSGDARRAPAATRAEAEGDETRGRRWHCSQSRGGRAVATKTLTLAARRCKQIPFPQRPRPAPAPAPPPQPPSPPPPRPQPPPPRPWPGRSLTAALPCDTYAPRLAAPMHHPAVLPCCRAATRCLPLTMMKHLRPHHHVISTSLSHPHIHPAQSPFALPSPCFLVTPVTPSPRSWTASCCTNTTPHPHAKASLCATCRVPQTNTLQAAASPSFPTCTTTTTTTTLSSSVSTLQQPSLSPCHCFALERDALLITRVPFTGADNDSPVLERQKPHT